MSALALCCLVALASGQSTAPSRRPHISDFTDPRSGRNPYLDLEEGVISEEPPRKNHFFMDSNENPFMDAKEESHRNNFMGVNEEALTEGHVMDGKGEPRRKNFMGAQEEPLEEGHFMDSKKEPYRKNFMGAQEGPLTEGHVMDGKEEPYRKNFLGAQEEPLREGDFMDVKEEPRRKNFMRAQEEPLREGHFMGTQEEPQGEDPFIDAKEEWSIAGGNVKSGEPLGRRKDDVENEQEAPLDRTPLIAVSAVGTVLLLLLGGVVWWKKRRRNPSSGTGHMQKS